MANKTTQSKHILQNKNNLINRLLYAQFICDEGLSDIGIKTSTKSIDLEKVFDDIFKTHNKDGINFIGHVVFTLYNLLSHHRNSQLYLYDTIYAPISEFYDDGFESESEYVKREGLLDNGSFLKPGYTKTQYANTLSWWNKMYDIKEPLDLYDLVLNDVLPSDESTFDLADLALTDVNMCAIWESGMPISEHINDLDLIGANIMNKIAEYKADFLKTHKEDTPAEINSLKKAFLMIDFEKVCELMYPAKHFKSSKVNKSGLDYENTQNELKKLRDEVKKMKAELKKIRSTPVTSGKS